MKTTFKLLNMGVVLFILTIHSRGNDLSLPEQDVARVQRYFQSKLPGYMEGASASIDYPGWKDFPTRIHHYKMADGKTASVIMCNADAKRLARWVVAACLEVKISAAKEHTDKLSRHIIAQSGAQFPVAGIVYENMDGKGNAIYAFRDGVTCAIPGITNGERKQVTTAELAASFNHEIPLAKAGKYARIASTLREEYKAAGGALPTDGLQWATTVRKEYQAAFNSDRNLLILAWAKANL